MKIKVVSTAQEINATMTRGQTVVVIDVLRATSVIVTALANGAAAVWPVLSVEEAFAKYQNFPADMALLGGERGGVIIPGFHHGNSPFSYSRETVFGKNIVLSTTNGTRAIRNSNGADNLFLLAMLNLPYAATKLKEVENLMIVCSGTNDRFSADDALCAGMLIVELEKFTQIETDDLGLVLRNFALQAGSPAEKLSSCYHLNYLKSIGYQNDIHYCLQIGTHNILPRLQTDGSVMISKD